MSDHDVTAIGIRQAGRTYLVVVIPDEAPHVIPPAPVCDGWGVPGWEWGAGGDGTMATAEAIAQVFFNTPMAPLRYLTVIAGLLARQPREGFELTWGEVFRALVGVFGYDACSRYVLNRVNVSACRERG